MSAGAFIHSFIHANLQTTRGYVDEFCIGRYPSIEAAPEPSDVLHENIEVSNGNRFLRRILSNSVSLVAIIITFAVIVSAKTFQVGAFPEPNQIVC
jgi:hypothetical protein